jgi:hypothetical protein
MKTKRLKENRKQGAHKAQKISPQLRRKVETNLKRLELDLQEC